jgi:uncharacterized membrane protein YoaK (UPF0700 family)
VTISPVFREAQEWLAVCLAAVAGYVDAYGFLSFKTFVSFMSGNTTHSGFSLGLGGFADALPALLAIVFFVSGVFTGTLLKSSLDQSRRLLFGAIAVFLALTIGVTHLESFTSDVGIVLLSFTMGMMNTVLSQVGTQMVNLTFVTGTLKQIGGHLALAFKRAPLKDAQGSGDTHLRRAILLTIIWAGFLTGAILGGAARPRFGVSVLLLPL